MIQGIRSRDGVGEGALSFNFWLSLHLERGTRHACYAVETEALLPWVLDSFGTTPKMRWLDRSSSMNSDEIGCFQGSMAVEGNIVNPGSLSHMP